MDALETTYLEALSELYPTASEAAEAAAMLEGVLALPRGTELFASDIHGEYNAFSHLLRNGSGAVRTLIADTFGAGLTAGEAAELAAVVAYPEEKALGVLGRAASDEAADAWLAATLSRLAALAHAAASRHGLAEVDALIPADFGAVAAALLAAQGVTAKAGTAAALIEAAIEGGYGVNLAITLAELTRHLVVDQLHLIGDVYDRGPAPHLIMDELLDYPAVDVQWGNHDILWMGPPAAPAAWPTWCASAPATATCPSWRTPTASTCAPWPASPPRPTPTTPASPSPSRVTPASRPPRPR